MNKIAIPALLLGVVMIAGAFAFMPVQEASTVHTTQTMTLGADSITAAKIADNALSNEHFNADFLTAAKIADNALSNEHFNADFLTASKIADNAFLAVNFNADFLTAAKIADDAIDTEHITAAFTTELQSNQIVAFDSADFSGTITCTATGASFLVHYVVGGLADAEVITIGGTATAADVVYTVDVTASTSSINGISGTVSGTTGENVTFDSSATTANIHVTIETATGATTVQCT